MSKGNNAASATAGMMGMTSFLNAAADTAPDRLSTIMNDRRCTWTDTRERVARFAGALQAMGIGSDDRVAILSLNSDRYTEIYFAVWWAGGAIVPMNLRWTVEENVYSLNDSEAEILIVDEAFVPVAGAIKAKADKVKHVIYAGDGETPEGMISYEELISESKTVPDASRGGEDLAGLYYTGGTTGFPKGVMLPHRAIWYNSVIGAKHLELGPEDIYLHAAPMFHLADGAIGNGVNAVGARHVYIPSFTPEAAIDIIEEQQVSYALMVPTMIAMLLQSPAFDPDRLSSLKGLLYGASPMPEGVLRDAIAKLPDVKIMQGYGQTELAPIVSILSADYHVLDGPKSTKLTSAGTPVIGCEVKILNEAGERCDYGEVGEIVARSPGAMLGYWKLPEQTAETLKDGWVHTGDGAYQDREGFIFIVDRLKDMIVTGGENVFSAEVESAISTHPAVGEVAIIGIPAETWGEAVHAIVVLKTDAAATEAEIIEHCRDRIANYKVPRSVEFRTEPLPLSGAGKVLKRDLRAPFWEGKERTVN